MKILYGITKSNFGGAQRYVFDLAVEARRGGHDVAVLTGGNGILIEKLKAENIRVINLPYLSRDIKLGSEIKSFFDILRILRNERPDVFHINSSKMGGTGSLAARIAGIKKIIFTAHGWAFNEKRHWVSLLFIEELAWLTILLSHKTICVSERLRKDVVLKPWVKNKLAVIHNGIREFDLFPKEAAREKLLIDLPKESLLVGTLSELHYTKGLDTALRAINKCPENIHFVVLGTGEYKNELLRLAKILGIQDRMHLLGYLDNARQYLKAFDIFTLTSRTEGLPYALLEAGIAEMPVVASNVGGIPEVIKDYETGILVPKENPKSLSLALTRLSQNIEEREKLGKNLKSFVTKEFSIEKMLNETFKLYN